LFLVSFPAFDNAFATRTPHFASPAFFQNAPGLFSNFYHIPNRKLFLNKSDPTVTSVFPLSNEQFLGFLSLTFFFNEEAFL